MLVLLPIRAVAVAITIPVSAPISIPFPVASLFPGPIAIEISTSIGIGSYITIGSVCPNAVALINRLHPLFHAAAVPLVVSALVILPALKIAIKTALIVGGKLTPTPLCEHGRQ